MKKKSVWLIEEGVYSDYSVYGVFSTKERALKAAALLKFGPDTVYERTLDPMQNEIHRGYCAYQLLMLRNGKVESINETTVTRLEGYPAVTFWNRSRMNAPGTAVRPSCLNIRLMARDKRHAIKIAGDIRREWLATNTWKED